MVYEGEFFDESSFIGIIDEDDSSDTKYEDLYQRTEDDMPDGVIKYEFVSGFFLKNSKSR